MKSSEQAIKEIKGLITQIEAKHSEELKANTVKMTETIMESIILSKDERRELLLHELHKDLTFLLAIPPLRLTQLIVAESADKHHTRDTLIASNKEAVNRLPEDWQERLYRVLDLEDQERMDGIARLQAFLKVRPALLQAIDELKSKS